MEAEDMPQKDQAKIKQQTSLETLCKGMDPVFLEYMKYCRNLKFEQEPDYQFLIELFKKRFDLKGFIDDN